MYSQQKCIHVFNKRQAQNFTLFIVVQTVNNILFYLQRINELIVLHYLMEYSMGMKMNKVMLQSYSGL